MTLTADLVFITRNASALTPARLDLWRSLKTQGLNRLIVVCEETLTPPEDVLFETVLCTDVSPMLKRWAGFRRSSADLVIFNDDDVFLDAIALEHLLKDARRQVGSILWAGTYLNPISLSSAGRAYNLLCNHWVKMLSASHPRFLGGAFALLRAPESTLLWEGITQYGGEEDLFARRWVAAGGTLRLCEGFSPRHESRKSLWGFLVRAVRQGQAAVQSQMPLARPTGFQAFQAARGWERMWVLAHGLGLLGGAFAAKWFQQKRAEPAHASDSIDRMSEARPEGRLQATR